MSDEPLKTEIDRIRGSGILGRSGFLPTLFDFLAARTLAGQPPKEVEIALEVFRRDGDFAGSEDSVVRVYVHRLRRKLEDFYLREGGDGAVRLELPKGEYRLALTSSPLVVGEAARPRRFPRRAAIAAATVGLIGANVAAWAWFGSRGPVATDTAATTALWTPLAEDKFPLLIVVGDYYLVGDSDRGMDVDRLVREFQINSREDLYGFLAEHPAKVDHYSDVGLSYLPVSVALALHAIVPLLPRGKPARVIPSSEFSTEYLKTNDVVYVGHLSGLRSLSDSVFAASRFTIGETFDDIVDTVAGTHYMGRAGGDAQTGVTYRDYGYISTFRGPAGNRILVIAGTRDAAATAAAEQVTDPAKIRDILTAAASADSFEALLEIEGKGRINLQSRLIAAAALDPGKIWAPGTEHPRRLIPRG